MEKFIEIIQRNVSRYYSKPFFFYFTIAAILFLMLDKKQDVKKRTLGLYSIITIVAILNPVFCSCVWEFLRYGGVYWRLLWLFPSTILMAWAGTELIFRGDKKIIHVMAALLVTASIILGGTSLYRSDAFSKRPNWEKIPEITAVTMTTINENAEKTGNKYKRLAAPVDILCQIRQLDATILQYGGRELDPASRNEHKFEGYYYKLMDGLIQDYNTWIVRIMRKFNTNYIVFPTSYGLSGTLEEKGAECIYHADGWEIWYMKSIRNVEHKGEYPWLKGSRY